MGNPNVTTAAGAVGYADHGAILTLPRGDTITEAWDYNTRLQPISITVGSAFSASLWYCDGFAATCTDNNGNIKGITIGSLGNVNQSYSYDHLNRLTGASEGSAWSRGFNYDNSGNQWVTPQAGLLPFTPTASNSFNANNQLIDPATPAATNTFRYDASGNQTNAGSYVFKWDSEGRPVSSSINGSTVSYQYDGDGRRVMKQIDTAAPTVYIYDAMGELAAEIGAPVMSGCTTCYLSVDHLGSTRAVTDSAGSVVERHDYLPFGEELYSGTGTRSAALKYIASTGSSGMTDKFTGKERDAETGLDYFGARYMSSAQGRFTSADPKEFTKRTISNPQKWNKYAYVLNNPLALFDPDGREEIKVTVRAFIPDSSFKYPAGIGPTWKGDGRSFSSAPNASSRGQATFTIETEPAKSAQPLVGGKPTFSTSGSEVNWWGLGTQAAKSDVTGTVNMNTRTSDGTSVVSVSMSASDPLIPGAPPTGGNFTFNVALDGSSVSINGMIAAYPAFEVYVQNGTTGDQGTLLQYTPAGTSANSPGALLTGATVPVRGTTTLPDKPQKQCTTGDPSCK